MSYFNNDEEDFVEKISLDELYDRKNEVNQNRIQLFNKILNRVHNKIKVTARQKHDEQYCFYVVPEVILGIPRYDVDTCISYIVEKLTENGFRVKYTHPNLLFISWQHYIPAYERQQIKKETGKKIDGFGNIVGKEKEENETTLLTNTASSGDKSGNKSNKKDYKDIDNYKPSGIYNMNLFSNLKKLE